MPAEQQQVYYCTQCQIETTLSKVCPKCHRKTTLQAVGQGPAVGGARRRARSSAHTVAGEAAARRLWWIGGGLAALLLAGGLVWWAFGQRKGGASSKRAAKAPREHRFDAPAPGADPRVFGARPKGVRVAPPPPPRLCGTGYRIRVGYRFTAAEPGKAGAKAGKGKAGAKAGKGKAGAKAGKGKAGAKGRRDRPEAIEHRHEFLVAGRAGKLTYVPLAFEIRATVNGRTGTGLKLDRRGGVLPDPRTRRLRRVGPNDSLEPGLRISDLIGRGQASLRPDPAGGLRISGVRRRNRLVSGWVQTGVGLATFLLPRPPKPGSRTFTDARLPPKGMFAGVSALVRRFRRKPAAKAAPGTATYQVDSPAAAMRKAGATVRVEGEVQVASGEVLPRGARLTLQGLPVRKGSATAATIRFEHLGPRCNDK